MNAELLRALRVVSVERGLDPRDFALVAFGGAGPLHACELADELEIGACSCRPPRASSRRSASSPPTSGATACARYVVPLAEAGELPDEGEADLRYRRPVVRADRARSATGLADRFHAAHEERYGWADRRGRSSSSPCAPRRSGPGRACRSPAARLAARGPAGARAGRLDRLGAGRLGGRDRRARHARPRAHVNVELQVLGAALRAVAEEMGAALVRAAFSPEHQGAARLLDGALRRPRPDGRAGRAHPGAPRLDAGRGRGRAGVRPRPGETWILNDPYSGGTHLPDVTLVSRTPLGFAATRAHHADVGGSEPGSLPAGSRTLDEEGVVIPPTRLDDRTLEALVAQMRNPDERRGDLRAQLAANRLAERRLDELAARRGESAAARGDGRARRLLGATRAGGGGGAARRALGGRGGARGAGRRRRSSLRAAVTVAGDGVEIDFAGTAPQHAGNLNCPLAGHPLGVRVRAPLPDRSGRARLGRRAAPLTVRAPAGCLVNALPPGGGGRRQRRDVEQDRRRALRRLRPGACRCRRRARGR